MYVFSRVPFKFSLLDKPSVLAVPSSIPQLYPCHCPESRPFMLLSPIKELQLLKILEALDHIN